MQAANRLASLRFNKHITEKRSRFSSLALCLLYHEAKMLACASSQITLVPFLLCKNVTCCIAPPFPKSLRLFGFPLFLRSRQFHSSLSSAIGQRPKACTASLSVDIIPYVQAANRLASLRFNKHITGKRSRFSTLVLCLLYHIRILRK